jgi:hypothetical protein
MERENRSDAMSQAELSVINVISIVALFTPIFSRDCESSKGKAVASVSRQ